MLSKEEISLRVFSHREAVERLMGEEFGMDSSSIGRKVIPACMVGMPTPSEMIDDILFSILNGKVALRGFKTNAKVDNYFFISLNRNIRAYIRAYYIENITPLTDDEREYWHQFTRDFFDKVLSGDYKDLYVPPSERPPNPLLN